MQGFSVEVFGFRACGPLISGGEALKKFGTRLAGAQGWVGFIGLGLKGSRGTGMARIDSEDQGVDLCSLS